MFLFRYNVRSLIVRKTTTLATMVGIALVVFVLASAMMLVRGIDHTLSMSGREDNAIVLRQGASSEIASNISTESFNTVLTSPGIKSEGGVPVAVGELLMGSPLEKLSGGKGPPAQFRLTSERGYAFRPELKVVRGTLPRPGTNEIIFGKALRDHYKGLEVGQTIEIRHKPLQVVGMFESSGSAYESEIWGDLTVLSSIFGRQGRLSSIHVRLDSPRAFEAFRISIEKNKQLGFEVQRETEYFEKLSEGLSMMFGIIGGTISLLAAIGAMIGAMITMHGSIANRQREIGTLRALGFSRGLILRSFLLESVLLTLGGGLVGAVASLAMGFVRFSTMNTATLNEVVLSFEPSAEVISMAVGAAAALGIMGGFFPAVRAARIPAISALRG